MQHLVGSIGSTVSVDHGDFISIGGFRVRKSLIMGYRLAPADGFPADSVNHFGVAVLLQSGWNLMTCETKEIAEIEIQKLDWIFKKDAAEATK